MAMNFHGMGTMIVERRGDSDDVRIGFMHMEPGGGETPLVLVIRAMGGERIMPIREIDTSGPIWYGETFPSRYPVTVRPTIEDDALSAMSMGGGPGVPLPLPVLEAIHRSEGIFNMPQMWAMTEDDGFVATLMLSTDVGLYVRASGLWHSIEDEDVVDGLNAIEVEGPALDMFDQFDRAGQLVNITAMPKVDPHFVMPTPEGEAPVGEVEDEATVTASLTMAVPVIASLDDVPAAIEMAQANEDIRWFVERRARAFGYADDFPWT